MMRGDRCCMRCRALPGTCGMNRDCKCHRIEEARFKSTPDLTALLIEQRAVEASFNRDRRKA